MTYFENLKLLLTRIPLLILVPFMNRGINLIFTPFLIGLFGNQGFIKVSILLLISFVLSVTIELGIRQKVLIFYKSEDLLKILFLKWLILISTFLFCCVLLQSLILSQSRIIDSRDLMVVGLDALINVSINSFYLGYLQARGESNSILRVNVQCLLLVSIPRVYLLLNEITEPWLWVLFGSVFRLLIFGRIIVNFRIVNFSNLFSSNIGIKLFDKGNLNSFFGLIVVLTLSLDKFVGTRLYESSSFVSYLLAFQFVSMTGSLYEQILVRYFPSIRDSLLNGNAWKQVRIIFFGLIVLCSILNLVYTGVCIIVFKNLNPIFFPSLMMLSFQSIAWGLLIIWQNVLAPSRSNFDHVRYMGVALVFESLALIGLLYFRNLGVIFLAGVTATSFLVCLVGLSKRSEKVGIYFVPSHQIVLTFLMFLFSTAILYVFRTSIYGVIAIFALISFALFSKAIFIRFFSNIENILGKNI